MLRAINDDSAAQVALCFRRFFAHQVAHSRPIAFDFPGASHLESLLGAGVGLHLRHDKMISVEKWIAKVAVLPKGRNETLNFFLLFCGTASRLFG